MELQLAYAPGNDRRVVREIEIKKGNIERARRILRFHLRACVCVHAFAFSRMRLSRLRERDRDAFVGYLVHLDLQSPIIWFD